jgi:hypothetical protein
MLTRRITTALLSLALLPASALAQDTRPLAAQIAQADQAFFRVIFDDCTPEAIRSLVTDDFEFYHDKWGRIAGSKDDFVKAIQGLCERQRAGTDFKGRRVLLDESVEVLPMRGYGAIQMGRHRFFKVEPGKPDVPTERARFTHLWRLDGGKWLLARVLSYDHVNEPGWPPKN